MDAARSEPAQVTRDQPSCEAAAPLSRSDRDHEYLGLVLDNPGDHESDDGAGAARCTGKVTEYTTIGQKPFEFGLAPTVTECARMQCRKRRGVAETRVQQRRLCPTE